jgi:tRNA threonylcarbamoyladenosine biosynthesis protein TsaB
MGMVTYILHLETSTKVCSVALSENGTLRSFRDITDDQYAHGEKLTLLIQEILNECGLRPADLSAVSVASGPGSYTGLRIGVSTAKGLCYALKIPLIAVNAIESLAAFARERYPSEALCPMIDARRMEVYSAIFNSKDEEIKCLSADILDESSYSEFEPFVCFGDGSGKMKELWGGRNIVFDDELYCTARGQVKAAYKRFSESTFEDLAYFEPLYLKEFQGGK